MPEQMKFWELKSAFRDWPETLREVLTLPQWREPYLRYYQQFNRLCDEQDRDALDALVPLELSRDVAAKCPAQFVYDPVSRHLRSHREGEPLLPGRLKMNAVDVHDQFGGPVIEEVFERGSVEVPTTPEA